MGIWLSEDPFEGIHDRPMSLNGYGWVEGNVPNGTDASGRCVESIPCPNPEIYVPPANEFTRRYVDIQYAQRDFITDLANFITPGDTLPWIALTLAAERARDVGNVNAARMLFHWLSNSGTEVDLNVDQMLFDLPKWRQDIRKNILNPSVRDLLLKVTPTALTPNCSLYTTTTTGGYNPLTGGYDTWRRVGQGGTRRTDADIYSTTGISTSPSSSDFQGFHTDMSDSATYSRAELDWFLAINAFDYSLGISIVAANQSSITVCYKVYVADEYGWYNLPNSEVDRAMYRLELNGVGTNYRIRGSSNVRCEKFTIVDFAAPEISFQGPS